MCESIRTDVQANQLDNLTSAIGLARFYEAREIFKHKSSITAKGGSQSPNVAPLSLPRVLIKKMTIEELNEWKKKGLCFKCNEKFSPGHRCKRLFLIQASFGDNDEDVEMEIVGDDAVEQIETAPAISFHAMVGTQTSETMLVMGGWCTRT